MPSVEEILRPELIFALVGAAGTRLNDLSRELKQELSTFGYKTIDIRLSDLLTKRFPEWRDQKVTGEFERITHLQGMGNAFRRSVKDGAALARAAIAEIRARRANVSRSPDRPAPAHAYILHQLKHPDEVDLLRQVYGSSFVLVAGHAPHDLRRAALARLMAEKELKPGQDVHFYSNASLVVDSDEKQEDEFGQNTRDTYPKADFFANLGLSQGEFAVRRFVDLLFGHPFHTPAPDEYAMYLASASSLRSSDGNRQVGAVIVSLTRDLNGRPTNADMISVGMNEVPRGGGGFYWDNDSPDCRDQALLQWDQDRATAIKTSALAELIERIRNKKWLSDALAEEDPNTLAKLLLPDLKRTQFMDIGEFSRPVHAEMAALIDGARRGVAVNGHSMYVTTFPCHNCAKHIIAAGLRRVVYLEPYPKSRAGHLYTEEIVLESADCNEVPGRVVFCAFSGIAPRQYRQLFSMSERGAKKGKSLTKWNEDRLLLSPRYVPRNAASLYVAEERQELEKLNPGIYQWDKDAICPA